MATPTRANVATTIHVTATTASRFIVVVIVVVVVVVVVVDGSLDERRYFSSVPFRLTLTLAGDKKTISATHL
jgi:hypothetical protein